VNDLNKLLTTKEVIEILKITKSELFTVLRPVRSGGKTLPPIFTPESPINQIAKGRIFFTHKDIDRLYRYFKALKEYKAARAALRTHNAVSRNPFEG
jgi:hypothetical protein